MNHPLSEAEEPIRQALERLVGKDVRLHPFVVVEKVGRPDVFVQFAIRARDSRLYFDVPRLGIVLEETTPAMGAARAVMALSAWFDVQPDERVLIREEEDRPRGIMRPFWRRLFA